MIWVSVQGWRTEERKKNKWRKESTNGIYLTFPFVADHIVSTLMSLYLQANVV